MGWVEPGSLGDGCVEDGIEPVDGCLEIEIVPETVAVDECVWTGWFRGW